MLFDQYKTALLFAIETYQVKKGKALSKQRKKDIEALISIIKNPAYTNAHLLKSALEIKLYKMKTGFWIFQTGHSDLKIALHAILRAPQNQPEAISRAEVIAAEEQRQALASDLQLLNDKIAVQQDHLLKNQIEIKLQHLQLNNAPYYIGYDAYCLHVLDKFIKQQTLHLKEVEQLTDLLKDDTLNSFDTVMRKAIQIKIADACQSAFSTMQKNVASLIDHDHLIMPNFMATMRYAQHYCQSVKDPAAIQSPYLERQLSKLMHSYCADGAGKTAVGRLSTYAKSLVLESKETLILEYGSEVQQNTLAPLRTLRQTSQWAAFKAACVEKSCYFIQWLRDKNKTPRASLKDQKIHWIEETPVHKSVARRLQFSQ